MEERDFFMLGVIHRDGNGPELLERWLECIGPAVITLEFSRYGISFRQRHGEQFKARIQAVLKRLGETGSASESVKETLLSYVNLPYEFVVTSRYAEARSLPVYPIDMDFFSYLKLRDIDDLLSIENMARLKENDDPKAAEKERNLAKLVLEKGFSILPYSEEMYVRDRYMSNKISVLKRYHSGKRFLHICGWQHLKDPCGFYAHLNPVKVFNYDKALCI